MCFFSIYFPIRVIRYSQTVFSYRKPFEICSLKDNFAILNLVIIIFRQNRVAVFDFFYCVFI